MNSITRYSAKAAGDRRRSVSLALAAVAVASLMMLLPVISASGSDAFTDDAKGCLIEVKEGATDDELAAAGMSRADIITEAISNEVDLLKLSSVESVSCDKLTYSDGYGIKVSGMTYTTLSTEDTNITGISVTYIFNAGNDVIAGTYLSQEEQEVADAITTYLGITEYSAGDKLVVTGTIDSKTSTESVQEFLSIDDTHCVMKKGTMDVAGVTSISLTFTYKPVSGTGDKSFSYNVEARGSSGTKAVYEYEGQTSEITNTTKGTRTMSYSADVKKASESWKVDGKTFNMTMDTHVPPSHTTNITANVEDPSDYTTDGVYIPPYESSDHVKVTKTYDAVSSEASSIEKEATKNKSKVATYVVIGVGIAAVIAIGAVAFVLIRKSMRA
jgi:hypothetical protein